jgi:hypothetical protein
LQAPQWAFSARCCIDAFTGKEEMPDRRRNRRTDKLVAALFVLVFVAVGVAVFAALTALGQSRKISHQQDQIERILRVNAASGAAFRRESLERRDDNCTLFERQEETARTRIAGTYKLLGNIPRSEWGGTIAKAIANSVNNLYKDAKASKSPRYCNEARGQATIGLPEPGPKIPKRHDVSKYLKPYRGG